MFKALMQCMLSGRQTGTAEWKASRGETGPVEASSSQAPLAGTRWLRAKDKHLQQAQPNRLCGGAIRASGDNPPSETALQVGQCPERAWHCVAAHAVLRYRLQWQAASQDIATNMRFT